MTSFVLSAQENPDTLDFVRKALALFRVQRASFKDLYISYSAYDRKLHAEESWDPRHDHKKIHQAKALLMKMDPVMLDRDQQEWRREILLDWFNRALPWVLWINTDLSQDERTCLAHLYLCELENIQWSSNADQQELCKWYANIWRHIINDNGLAARLVLDGLTGASHRFVASTIIDAYKANRHRDGLVWVKPYPVSGESD